MCLCLQEAVPQVIEQIDLVSGKASGFWPEIKSLERLLRLQPDTGAQISIVLSLDSELVP